MPSQISSVLPQQWHEIPFKSTRNLVALLFTWRSNFLCEMPARGASLIIIYNYKLDSILKTFHSALENVQPGLSSLLYYRRLRFVLDFARCYYYKKI